MQNTVVGIQGWLIQLMQIESLKMFACVCVCVCVCGFVCACTDERRRGGKKSLTTEDNKLDWKR